MFFEENKYYKHTSGTFLHTMTKADTSFYGEKILAEEIVPNVHMGLTAVGFDSEDEAVGYSEITQEEWLAVNNG